MSKNPWFRLYTETVDDEKLRLLAFEDRWHFVALLCCKGSGLLDSGDEPGLLRRKLAVKLGLSPRELEEVARRMAEVGLIDSDTFQPLAWDDRQFKSDTSTERVRKYRERMKRTGNVSVTAQETDTDTDTDTEEEQEQKKARKRATPPVKPDDVDDSTWRDWLTLRRAKKAPVTETVLKQARAESAKAGLPLNRFLEIWCARGSQGLQADWLKPQERGKPSAAASFHGKTYTGTPEHELPESLRPAH